MYHYLEILILEKISFVQQSYILCDQTILFNIAMIHITIKKDKEKPESIDKSEELCSLVLLVMLQCGGRGKIYHKPRSMLYGIDRQNLYHNNKKDNNIKMWGSKLFHYM